MQKAPTPPPAPDPYATAQAQGRENTATAVAQTAMNNADEITPYGSVHYGISRYDKIAEPNSGKGDVAGGGGVTYRDVPVYERITSLTPAQQELLWQQEGLGRQSNQTASDLLTQYGQDNAQGRQDLANLPDWQTSLNLAYADPNQRGALSRVSLDQAPTTFGQTANAIRYGIDNAGPISQTFGNTAQGIQYDVGPNDFSADRLRVEQALYDRINPQLTQSRDALDAKLRNQGLVPGTEAYNIAIDAAGRQENDARLAITAQGGQEQSRLFSDALNQGQFRNSAQQQDYGQLLGRAQYALGAQGQQYSQNANDASFWNAAQAQDFGQLKDRGLFGLQATAQNNDARLSEAGFNNGTVEADWAAYLQRLGFNNSAAEASGTFANTARQNAMQGILAQSNNTVNQIGALMGQGQVTVPQFSPYRAGTMDPAPVAQSVYQSAQLANQQWQTQAQMAAQNNAGLFGLGSSLLGGFGRLATGGFK